MLIYWSPYHINYTQLDKRENLQESPILHGKVYGFMLIFRTTMAGTEDSDPNICLDWRMNSGHSLMFCTKGAPQVFPNHHQVPCKPGASSTIYGLVERQCDWMMIWTETQKLRGKLECPHLDPIFEHPNQQILGKMRMWFCGVQSKICPF